MKLNRKDLRKIQYGFNSYSNRLLQANFQDYLDVLRKFLNYIKSVPIIYEYIQGCGNCEVNLEQEVKEVQRSCGRKILTTGDTEEEEVCIVYATLQYIVDHNIEVHRSLAWGYATSDKFQDKVKGFNDRFVMVLIRHIESYLTKVGIDMGVDEKVVYNVTVQSGQAIIANDNASVTATANIGLNTNELNQLIDAVRSKAAALEDSEKEAVMDSLEVIEAEVVSEKPKKGMLKTALKTLDGVKDTVQTAVELGSAIAKLTEFVMPLLGM